MSKLTIDDLEVLTPDQLWGLFYDAIRRSLPDYPPQVQYIKDLITAGCPIGPRSNGDLTALHYAIFYNFPDIAKFIVSEGADIHIRDKHGFTALHFAARDGNLEMVKFLLSRGADIHARTHNMIYNPPRVYTPWDYANDEIRKSIPELKP